MSLIWNRTERVNLIYTFYIFSGSPFKSLSPTPKCVPDKDESQEEEEDENGKIWWSLEKLQIAQIVEVKGVSKKWWHFILLTVDIITTIMTF